MNKLVLGFVTALALMSFGCKKKGGASSDEALKKANDYKAEICACKDVACATAAQTKYAESMKGTATDKDAKPDPDLQAKMAPILTAAGQCMTDLQTAGAGSAAAGSADGSAADSADGSAA
ncbi:MAG: hypothetical protein AB7L28_28020, partial [Kofleriaceae bacterium]